MTDFSRQSVHVPLIADFGVALPVNSHRFDNPEDFDGLGKKTRLTLKQYITFSPLVEPPNAIGEHTSVFHLGFIMHEFLNGLKDFDSLADYKEGQL